MTDKQALRKLIEAVETGSYDDETQNGYIAFGKCVLHCDQSLIGHYRSVWNAYHGSLDAAKQLHETLVPEFDYILSVQDGYPHAECFNDNAYKFAGGSNLSRDWLIAILKAYEAKQ